LDQHFTQWIGIVAGVFTAMSLLPQLVKLIRSKKAEDISLFYLIILFFGLGLWIWYGFMRKDLPIIATNLFSLLVNISMIVFGVKYKRKNKKQNAPNQL
jgi:MtN3 and saliva related transmembrane protein